MQKMLFIFNPKTGGGRLRGKLMQILCLFSGAGYEVTVHPTAATGDARSVAAEKAESYDLVVCCGGDGTLNEVVGGLMQCQNPPELGYIPGGTTNDFANSLQLPRSDMVKAAQRVVKPKKVFACDVGLFNERVFNYVAAFGAFTDVPYKTPQTFKNVLGYSAYILEAIQKLPGLHPYNITVQCDKGSFSGEFIYGMVSNSTSVGGFSFMGENKVKMDDGLFEVLLVRYPQNISDLGQISAALLTHDASSPLLLPLVVQQIVVTAPEPIPWTLDGEFGGSLREADIRVQQKGVRIRI